MICDKCKKTLPDDSEFCHYCGNNLSKCETTNATSIKPQTEATVCFKNSSYSNFSSEQKSAKKNTLTFFANLLSVLLLAISNVLIVIALNLQDSKRNYLEKWNTSIVYLCIIALLAISIVIGFYSLLSNKKSLLTIFSVLLASATIIVMVEGSIISSGWINEDRLWVRYFNDSTVDLLNTVWITNVFLNLGARLLAFLDTLINNWHSGIKYRESCFDRIAKMHKYLEEGIISQEEFDRYRADILKYTK